MSVLDQIKQLEEQKAQLLEQAKTEALAQAEAAIKTLNELGFNYRIVEGNASTTTAPSSGGRRTGVRADVLRVIEERDGINRGTILELMDAKGDKKAEQSISNALANLKKSGQIDLADGMYRATQP